MLRVGVSEYYGRPSSSSIPRDFSTIHLIFISILYISKINRCTGVSFVWGEGVFGGLLPEYFLHKNKYIACPEIQAVLPFCSKMAI